MLIKRKNGEASRGKFQAITAGMAIEALDRRSFLARSGLAIGGLAAVGSIQLGAVRKAKAIDGPKPGVETVIKKNICTHCSV
ncbi:MAG: twin-arginine translocation signal domain-containing protein, partial [Microvirga sp.]